MPGTYRVAYSRRARAQLQALRRHIAAKAGRRVARDYVASIVATCDGLDTFPHRGSRRDDLRPGVRTLGFRRRVTIAFEVDGNLVVILGVFYGGQDFEATLRDDEL